MFFNYSSSKMEVHLNVTERTITAGLTEEEEDKLVELLGKVNQPWSAQFYNAAAPLFTLTTVELPCFWQDESERGLKVFLFRRPDNDKYWPRKLHSPGTVLRAKDEGYDVAIKRVVQQELGLFHLPVFRVDHSSYINHTPRGHETPRIFLSKLDDTVAKSLMNKGAFYNADHLPNDLIDHHYMIIKVAMEHYRRASYRVW